MTAHPHRKSRLAAFFGVAVFAVTPLSAHAETLTGTATVIDGDTLEIHGDRIRLHGVDAPESSQSCKKPDGTEWRCGQKAGLALQDKIAKRPVTCEGAERGKYGRLIGTCSVGGENLNAWLAENGWVMAYRHYSEAYVPMEEKAKAAHLNIWNGTFENPGDFRKKKKARDDHDNATAAAARKPGCDIKGNIGKTGKRIYHLPGSEWYEKTRINTDFGEGWFCSEAEAKAAGFAPAQPSKEGGATGGKPTGKHAGKGNGKNAG